MKKSICIEKLFIDLPFYDRFAMVRKTGFDYVEFGSWEQHDVKRIKELLTENQLKLGCFSGDKDYNIIDPAHCGEFLDYLKRSAEVAHELDCKNLVLHSNALAEEGRMCTSGNELSERTKIAAATKNLLAAAEVAGASQHLRKAWLLHDNVRVGSGNHPGGGFSQTETAL